MKDEVRKKVLIDLFASPITIGPVVCGLTMALMAWAASSAMILAAGLGTAVLGVGVFFTRLTFGLDKITKDAYDKILKDIEDKKNKALDDLDYKLRQDKDPRPERCLRDLRSAHKLLRESMKTNRLGSEVLDNFNRLFEDCVMQITKTDDLWRNSKGMSGASKRAVTEQRERIVVEVQSATEQLMAYVQDMGTVSETQSNSEISQNLKELQQSLDVARRTEARMANLGSEPKSYDIKEFE